MQTSPRPLYPLMVPEGFHPWVQKVLKPETAAVIRWEHKMLVLALGAYRLRDAPAEPVYPGSKGRAMASVLPKVTTKVKAPVKH